MKRNKIFLLNIVLLFFVIDSFAASKAIAVNTVESSKVDREEEIINWHIGVLEGKNYFEDKAQSVRVLSDMKAKNAKSLLIDEFKNSDDKELKKAIAKYIFNFANDAKEKKEIEQLLLNEVETDNRGNDKVKNVVVTNKKDSVEYEVLCSLAREGNKKIIPVLRRWLIIDGVDLYFCLKGVEKSFVADDLNSVFDEVDKDAKKRIVLTSIIYLDKNIDDYYEYLIALFESRDEYDNSSAREIVSRVSDKMSVSGKRERVKKDIKRLKDSLKNKSEADKKLFDRIDTKEGN